MSEKLDELLKEGYIAAADQHKEDAEFFLPAQAAVLVNPGFFDDWDDPEIDAFYADANRFERRPAETKLKKHFSWKGDSIMTEHTERVESVLGIPVFAWKNWDELDEQVLVFYNVRFLLDSLKKYDNWCIAVDFGWNSIKAQDENGHLEKIELFNVPEFIEALKQRIKE